MHTRLEWLEQRNRKIPKKVESSVLSSIARVHLNSSYMAVVILLLCRCVDAQHVALDNIILYGGMEEPSAWRLGNATIENGVLRLLVENEEEISVATQLLPPLRGNGTLLLSIRAKADGATGDLNVDLYGFGWDSPLQELVIPTAELTTEFRRYASLIRSGSSDMGIWLRLFTSTTEPILVDEIVLRDVVALPTFESGRRCDEATRRANALRE